MAAEIDLFIATNGAEINIDLLITKQNFFVDFNNIL